MSSEEYWSNYLKDWSPEPFPCLTGLRPGRQTPGRGSVSAQRDGSCDGLWAELQTSKFDLQDVLYAAWARILMAYADANTAEVVFGASGLNNGLHHSESGTGLDLAVFPVRVGSSDMDHTNTQILEKIAQHRRKASRFPFNRYLNKNEEVSSKATQAIHTFVMVNDEDYALSKPNPLISSELTQDIVLYVKESGNAVITYNLQYPNQFLNETAASFMLQKLHGVAAWMSEHPLVYYRNALDAVSADLVACLNLNPISYSQEELLHHRFEGHARKTPENIALKFVVRRSESFVARDWTYRELDSAANLVASHIRGKIDAAKTGIVCILMEKSPGLYITILAILKAGAAWCSIDTISPVSRQKDLITRSGSSIAIVDDDIDEAVLPLGVTPLKIKDLLGNTYHSKIVSNKESTPTAIKSSSDTLAYLIYTSGTTGPPKGVLVSHSAAVASMNSLCQTIPGPRIQKELKCMQFSQQTFDVFVQDLFYTWGLGGILISSSKEIITGSFAEIVEFTKATHAHLTPAFGSTVPRKSCPTLEVITMIGERLPQHIADDWGSDIIAFNTYGPAEAAVVSTIKKFGGKQKPFSSSNIGSPLSSMSCYVLRDGQVVPRNGTGELALAGPQLAHGYLNNDTKTNERFIWHEKLNKRLYMTGDIVRCLSNGSLDFIGREDDLIKLQGIRIELSEISYAMANCHQAVQHIETMHFARSNRPAKVLVTFIAARLLEKLTAQGLYLGKAAVEVASSAFYHAKENLPSYMQPGVIIILGSIPRTTSAKVDRKVLQAVYGNIDLGAWESAISVYLNDKSQQREWILSETPIVEVLATTSGVRNSDIQRSSSLSALGIDSITAGSLFSRLQRSGIRISMSMILQCRTVGDLLSQITSASSRKQSEHNTQYFNDFELYWRSNVENDNNSTCKVLPTTNFQASVLAESLLNPLAYWSSYAFKLPMRTDLQSLNAAWKELSHRTEALRVSFTSSAELDAPNIPCGMEATFIQLIHPNSEPLWKVHNVERQDTRYTAQILADDVARKCAGSGFQTPLWAVNILNNFSEGSSIMLFTIHHSLHDAHSIDAIIQDLWLIHKSLPARLTNRVQLSDAVKSIYQPEIPQSVMKYWQDMLEAYRDEDECGFPDLTGSSQIHERRGLVSFKLSSNYKSLIKLVNGLEISVATAFRAAWGFVLLQYLESSKVVIGETLSERVFLPGLQDVIAPLIAVVPLTISNEGTGREILKKMDSFIKISRQHQGIDPINVRKFLHRPQGSPLYPAIFVFHPEGHAPEDDELEAEYDLTDLNVEHTLALNVHCRSSPQFSIEVFANKTKVTYDHVKLLALQVEATVKAFIGDLDRPISTVLSEIASNVLSRTTSTLPASVPDLARCNATFWISHHARENPLWNAVELAEDITAHNTRITCFTFGDLEAKSNKWASYFLSKNLYQSIIAVCLPRCFDLYAVTIGILKSRNTYLPIEENLPTERKRLLLEDSHSRAIVLNTAARLAFRDLSGNIEIINITDQNVQVDVSNRSSGHIQLAQEHDDAYILYTSGSTGKPKGVLIPHRGLCGFVEGLAAYIGSCSQRPMEKQGTGKWLGLSSRAFDVHLCEMFLGWRLGLSFATAPREIILDDLKTALIELRITHAAFVPSLLEQADISPSNVPDLVYFSVGGEKISADILRTWGSQNQTLVVNAYGPTEVSIGCCAAAIVPTSTVRNIGRPFGNTTAHVLLPNCVDYALIGQTGELCMTGDLVGSGYLDRPDAKGFIDFHGERMFRTGDNVRMLADGSLDYLGRSDDQAKIRGQRIELGEVTQCLQKASSEDLDIATLLLQHPALPGTQLVSFVAVSKERSQRYDADPQTSPQATHHLIPSLLKECKIKLPAFMVPTHILPVSTLPLARISGKADAKRLKAYFGALSVQDLLSTKNTSITSRGLSKDEQTISDAISKTFPSSDISMTPASNVFDLGLDSLTAIKLAARLRKSGFQCSLVDIFALQTVEQLATLQKSNGSEITAKQEFSSRIFMEFEDRYRHLMTSEQYPIEHIRPCLPLQEGSIVRSLNEDNKHLYVNHLMMELPEGINMERLKASWISVIRQSPILRTTFRSIDRVIVQVILRPGSNLRWKSTSIDDRSHEAIVKAIQNEAARSILDGLLDEPPIRLHEFSNRTGQSYLCASLHHALYDAVSLNLVLNQVYAVYHSRNYPVRTPFDHLISFYLQQSEIEQKRFWTTYLADITVTKFEAVESLEAKIVERSIQIPLTELKAQASKFKVTLSTLCLTIFGAALAQTTASKDVTFGLVLSGRAAAVDGAERILGPCITTVPQRIKFDGENCSLENLTQALQHSIAECLEYQHTPLRKIHHWLQKDKVFDSLVQYLSDFTEPVTYSEEWKITEASMPDDYPLNVQFLPDTYKNELRISISCNSAFGSERDAVRFYELLNQLFESLEKVDLPDFLHINRGQRSAGSINKFSHYEDQSFSSIETLIRDTLAEYLGIQLGEILRSTSFFRLGIDSVAVLELARRLKKVDIHVRGSELMRYPCIGALSEYLLKIGDSKLTTTTTVQDDQSMIKSSRSNMNLDLDLDLNDLETVYNCTSLQSGMLTATIASDGVMYVHHHVFKLAHEIDTQRLSNAWNTLQQKRDILRTSFWYDAESSNTWKAIVRHSWPVDVQIVKDQRLPIVLAQLHKSMVFVAVEDFETPPLSLLVVEENNANFLILSLHHALYDGLSLQMICDDLALQYQGIPVSHRTHFFQAAKVITAAEDKHINFWADAIQGYIPPQIDIIPESKSRSIFLRRRLSCNKAEIIRGCQSIGVTVQSAALLAFAKVLAGLYKQRDIMFGHVISGRSLPLPGAEDIIGPLFNTVPVRIRFDTQTKSNSDLVCQIQEFTGLAQDCQQVSLRKSLNLWRTSYNGKNRPINALFLYQKLTYTETTTVLKPHVIEDDLIRPEYPLNLELEQHKTHFTVLASSSDDYYDRAGLEGILNMFGACLEDVIRRPKSAAVEFLKNLGTPPMHLESPQTSISTSKNLKISSEELNILKRIISKLSKVPVDLLTPESSIYTLGLDSILAIKVASLCRENGLKLSVADVIQGETLGGICQRATQTSQRRKSVLQDHKILASSFPSLSIPENEVENILPCLSGQLYQLDKFAYSLDQSIPTFAYIVKSRIDVPRLEQAWNELKRLNPILRTLFEYNEQENPAQIILKAKEYEQSLLVFENHPDTEGSLFKTIHRLSYRDLATDQPTLLLAVLRRKDQDVLLLSLHHALYDANSLSMLIEDLAFLYLEEPLEKRVSFEDFVTKHHLSSNEGFELGYWREKFESISPSILERSILSTDSRPAYKSLPNTTTISTIDSAARKLGVSKQAILISALASTVAKHTGSSTVILGHYISGRSSHPNGESVSGPCLNMLPLIVKDALSSGIKHKIQMIRDDLAIRTAYEQSNLVEVLNLWNDKIATESAVQKDKVPLPLLFNTYLNIVSKANITEPTNTPFFDPVDIDLERYEAFKGSHRQAHVTGHRERRINLSSTALYIDMVLNAQDGSLDLHGRSEGGLMNAVELLNWLEELRDELVWLVEQINNRI